MPAHAVDYSLARELFLNNPTYNLIDVAKEANCSYGGLKKLSAKEDWYGLREKMIKSDNGELAILQDSALKAVMLDSASMDDELLKDKIVQLIQFKFKKQILRLLCSKKYKHSSNHINGGIAASSYASAYAKFNAALKSELELKELNNNNNTTINYTIVEEQDGN
jgi:hypothetical protein